MIWTSDEALSQLRGADVRPDEVPLEFYMEGNIVFRQAGQTIYAERMYYDVQTQSGVILNGEMLTPIPGYKGLVRLKAEVIRQLNQYQFEGRNGGVTTSRMGVPSYWLQTGQFSLNNVPRSSVDPVSGHSNINPETGRPELEYDRIVTSRNNLLFLGSVPVLYWPSITSNLNDPRYYLNSFAINNDRVFGTQVLTGFNLYQLLGIHRPIENTEWSLNLDYLSERGFGFGTEFNYDVISPFGRPGRAVGFLDAWGINEEGFDNLGRERRSLVPEEDFRGRIFGRHRHFLPGGFQFNGEIGLISDRNFLEQYYEQDWDEKKDFTTGVELKRTIDNRSWSVTADGHVNDFFTQTEWLPRLDHFWIGESIFGDWMTWQEHSTIGYGHVTPATTPLDPADAAKFDPVGVGIR